MLLLLELPCFVEGLLAYDIPYTPGRYIYIHDDERRGRCFVAARSQSMICRKEEKICTILIGGILVDGVLVCIPMRAICHSPFTLMKQPTMLP